MLLLSVPAHSSPPLPTSLPPHLPCFLKARCSKKLWAASWAAGGQIRLLIMGQRSWRQPPPTPTTTPPFVISEHEDNVLWEDVAALIFVTWHTQTSCDTSPLCFIIVLFKTAVADLSSSSQPWTAHYCFHNNTESDSCCCCTGRQLVIHYRNMGAYQKKKKKRHASLSSDKEENRKKSK